MIKTRISIFVLIAIAIVLAQETLAQDNVGISTFRKQIFRTMDVTGEGVPDNIVLTLQAKSMLDPFKWSLEIYSDEKQIYNYSEDDTNIDDFFREGPGVEDCTDYLSCKKRWYFDVMGKLDIIVSRDGYDLEGILMPFGKGSQVLGMTRTHLEEKLGIRGPKADNIINSIEQKIRNGTAILISYPTSPVSSSPLEMFVPEIGKFVLIYAP